MTERERAFREIAESLIDRKHRPYGSCHGCINIGDDALLFLKKRFPHDLSYVRDKNPSLPHDKEASIVEEGHDRS